MHPWLWNPDLYVDNQYPDIIKILKMHGTSKCELGRCNSDRTPLPCEETFLRLMEVVSSMMTMPPFTGHEDLLNVLMMMKTL